MTDSALPFQRVSVIGAGTMGHGIAQVSAQAGYDVTLYDLTEEAVSAGAARIDKFVVVSGLGIFVLRRWRGEQNARRNPVFGRPICQSGIARCRPP